MAKKKLLYVGHPFHNKTKSTTFLKELLATKYDIEICDFDPSTDNMKEVFSNLHHKVFDILVIFQMMSDISNLKKYVSFKRGVFFPMYDGCYPRSNPIWLGYMDFNIINFSKTLHEELKSLGFSSYYIQYFPEPPKKIDNMGNTKSVFFWNRHNEININTLIKLLDMNKIKHIHIHRVADPEHTCVVPPKSLLPKISFSDWFPTRADIQRKILESAIYIAPRPYEGIGMSFLEAMAMGRCVIAPNNPTMNEYITHGETGLLYDLSNPKKLDLSQIRQIQHKTTRYTEQGYLSWLKNRNLILEWVNAKPNTQKASLNKWLSSFYSVQKTYYRLLGFLPVVKETKNNKTAWKLFNLFPIFRIKRTNNTIRYYVLYVPVLKIKEIKK